MAQAIRGIHIFRATVHRMRPSGAMRIHPRHRKDLARHVRIPRTDQCSSMVRKKLLLSLSSLPDRRVPVVARVPMRLGARPGAMQSGRRMNQCLKKASTRGIRISRMVSRKRCTNRSATMRKMMVLCHLGERARHIPMHRRKRGQCSPTNVRVLLR
jgi:hypothetical protein